jgi:NADH-ubiquinone oxidoreductase chain 2
MLLYSIILILLSNAVNNRRDSTTLYYRVGVITLLFTILLTYNNIYIDFISKGINIYNNLLFLSKYNLFITIVIFIVTSIILLISSFYYNNNTTQTDKVTSHKDNFITILKNHISKVSKLGKLKVDNVAEYPLIILFCISGGVFLMSSNDIISIFLSIELQSYGLYLLCSIYRNSETSVKAGLTYFLLGGLSSCIILLGQSILYFNTGNTNLENIYIINSIYQTLNYNDQNILSNVIDYLSIVNYIQYSFIIMLIGFLFKISASPFHFWSPDVYDAIPTRVTMFVAIVAKLSIITFLLELVYYTNNNNVSISLNTILLYSCILSLIIGSVLGLSQYRIKRLLAYSTISHLGFLLLALSINTYESIQSLVFYLIQYSFTNLNVFIILLAIGYTLYYYIGGNLIVVKNLIDKENSPIQLISQLRGYFWINPMISISLVITLFSFIGMPPLVGFFAKQMVLTTALNNGYIFITFIAILTSVISAVYYLVIVKTIFDNNILYKIKNNETIGYLSSSISLPISVFTLLISFFMFFNIENLLYIYI